jgi:hypothetical protein
MLTKLRINGYEIEFDREATAACYARIRVPGPEACGCAYCQNWVAARERVLPPDFQKLLSRLGVPDNGEIEVWETPGTTRAHFYGGWYLIVGRMITGEDVRNPESIGFQFSFSSGWSYVVSEFEGQEVFELQFTTEIDEYLSKEEPAAPP